MRLRSQAGFTLMEVMVALASGLVVLLAAFTLMDVTMARTGDVVRRVEATQKGRFAMDEVMRTLRSQVCRGTGSAAESAIVAGTSTAVTLYRDFSDGAQAATRAPDRVELELSGTELLERVYEGVGQTPAEWAYPAQPTRTRVLLEDVTQDGTAPVFSYFAFDTAAPPQPTVPLATVTAANASQVARIEVRFASIPPQADPASRQRLVLSDEVFVRHADPHDTEPRPRCA